MARRRARRRGSGALRPRVLHNWWGFWLYAPQYPGGAAASTSAHGMSGDVKEMNLLNHYIGMGHLEDAAPVERRLAGYGVAAIADGLVRAARRARGERLNKLVAIPPRVPRPLPRRQLLLAVLARASAEPPRAAQDRHVHASAVRQRQDWAVRDLREPSARLWLAIAGVACIVQRRWSASPGLCGSRPRRARARSLVRR